MDGNNNSDSTAIMLSDKYESLYNSVPDNIDEMKSVETEVMTRILKCNNDGYNITRRDVMNDI